MPQIDNAQFANSIGILYQGIAEQMAAFLDANIDTMSEAQINVFTDDEDRVRSYSDTFFTLSDEIAFDGSDACFAAISQATDGINADVKKIATANKWITVTAGVITLAAAVVSQNAGGAIQALASVVTTLKS